MQPDDSNPAQTSHQPLLPMLSLPGALQLPASFFAYRKQQHRWTCGPVQLWFKASRDIWASRLPLHRKLELILLYFGVRKFATHWVSLGFFCTLVPLSIFTPEVRQPCYGLIGLHTCVQQVDMLVGGACTSCPCRSGPALRAAAQSVECAHPAQPVLHPAVRLSGNSIITLNP